MGGSLALDRLDNLTVLQDVNLQQWASPLDGEAEFGRLPRGHLRTHKMLANAVIDNDAVGGSVTSAFLDGIENTLSAMFLGKYHEVGNVRRPVVARSLESKPVSLVVKGKIDETFGIPASYVGGQVGTLGVVASSRSVFDFIRHAIALVNLNDVLDFWIIVAPVGAHAGGAGVHGTYAVKLPQVTVEHLGIVRMDPRDRLHSLTSGESRQCEDPAFGEHDIAMTMRVAHAAFVSEHRREDTCDV